MTTRGVVSTGGGPGLPTDTSTTSRDPPPLSPRRYGSTWSAPEGRSTLGCVRNASRPPADRRFTSHATSHTVVLVGTTSGRTALDHQRVFGLRFVDAVDPSAVVAAVLSDAPRPRGLGEVPALVTPNVDHLVRLGRGIDPLAAAVIDGARYVLPDGQPVVWASRLLGRPLRSRLAGSDVVAQLWPELVAASRPVLVVAADDDVGDALRAQHPGAKVLVAPWLDRNDPHAVGRLAEHCLPAARDVEVVFVTLGFPRSEQLVGELWRRWPQDVPMPLCCAVGASFEMLLGRRRRGPRWARRLGLEWLVRCAQEPRRLGARYAHDARWFPPLVWREVRSARRTNVLRPAPA